MIPYGVGTSLEGHLLALQGGVSVDLSQMNKVLAINPEDLTVTVQAGVTRKQLNQEIRDTGFFFPIDPGADATIGGMSATGASGTNAVRYGTMRENVLGLTVVTGEAKVIRTARRARKSSAGYDLTRLFVGSEGTLGVITEITLRIYPHPEAVSAASCSFPDRRRCRADDDRDDSNGHSDRTLRVARCTDREGSQRARQARAARDAAAAVRVSRLGSERCRAGDDSRRNRARTWRCCIRVGHATGRPDAPMGSAPQRILRVSATETGLPQLHHGRMRANLAARRVHRRHVRDTEQSFLPAPILGHVGDGNFHCAILADTSKPEELAEAERLNKLIVTRALAMDGTCTGEHGVGMHKMDFLREEHGDDALELMARIKRSFDPLDILNPGKVVRV